jgi:hypothetical protein
MTEAEPGGHGDLPLQMDSPLPLCGGGARGGGAPGPLRKTLKIRERSAYEC